MAMVQLTSRVWHTLPVEAGDRPALGLAVGENAGLHFLLELDTKLPDETLARRAEERDLRLAFLSDYQHTRAAARPHTLVVNYPGADLEYLAQALDILTEVMGAE